MRQTNPRWTAPTASRLKFACRCNSPEELDATHARVVAAGYRNHQDPWDAFWGQRYAMLVDADGNRVDLFAAIAEEGVE